MLEKGIITHRSLMLRFQREERLVSKSDCVVVVIPAFRSYDAIQ